MLPYLALRQDQLLNPMPGLMPKFNDSKVLLLPTVLTKAKVYRDYETLCGNTHETPVAEQSSTMFGELN